MLLVEEEEEQADGNDDADPSSPVIDIIEVK
jgi:hypothetical protein